MHPARRLWEAVEPLHAVVYFAPEPVNAAKAIGLRGWWMGYFAGRFAPLGAIRPEPATAMAFGFAPRMVARALPDAWGLAPPDAVVESRIGAVVAALRRALPAELLETMDELGELLSAAVAGCGYQGRPLGAGWSAIASGGAGVVVPDDPVAATWVAATVLREHRGDGHVLAATTLGLGGLDTAITHIASGAVTRELIQPNRGWLDEEWDAAVAAAIERGHLDGDGRLTAAGAAVRGDLEDLTDRLAAGPVAALGPDGLARAVDLGAAISRHLMDTGVVPVANPIGVPRP